MPEAIVSVNAPVHIRAICDRCHAPLMPCANVEPNAEADEWVCSEQCSNGLYIDWSEDYMRELGVL